MDTLYQLKQCFKEDFTQWLSRSNTKAQGLVSELLSNVPEFDWSKFDQLLLEWELIEKECLQDILDILLREPKADYFWYSIKQIQYTDRYAMTRSELFYQVPTDEPSPVPVDSLKVDEDKIKALIRDTKINTILS